MMTVRNYDCEGDWDQILEYHQDLPGKVSTTVQTKKKTPKKTHNQNNKKRNFMRIKTNY